MSKPKILIVDDKPENLKALRKVLVDLDIELVEASSGNDALKATLRHDFVLALLDIQMPGMDGYELASILREEEKTAQLPFIFISAVYKDNLNVFKGYEQGAFSFITKPFQPELLINKVNFFIDKHLQKIALFVLHEELKSANKELEAFSYSVSHDLRAPLRSLEGFSKALLENYKGKFDEDADRWLHYIVNNANRMEMLINDMLEFSKVSRNNVNKTRIDMKQIVQDRFDSERKNYPEKTINFQLEDIPESYGDKAMIQQVWQNLISNALKYSSKKEEIHITVSSKTENGFHIYSVKDRGAGFDEKYKDKLYGVFQRLHSNNEFEGTGVGLAIVNRIIKKHNGTMEAQSELGKGAEFIFSIPINTI